MIRNTNEAILLLQDTDVQEIERTTAISYLRNHPTPQAIEALVGALEDDDYRVIDYAVTALATLGEDAFPTLLRVLAKEPASARGVIVNNQSALVRAESDELLESLEEAGADGATMKAAAKLLNEAWSGQ
jgi:HEAT repeat protein